MLKQLRDFYFDRVKCFQDRYRRVVPFGDSIVDRWEKAKALGFGENSSIYDSALVLGDVRVGSNVWIGPGVVLDGLAAPLTIGSFCSISAGVQIYTHDSVAWALTGGKETYTSSPVEIGSCVYIGPSSTLTAGVVIGDHCIVGAHSLVKHSIPSYMAAWGTPAKLTAKIIFTNDTEFYLDHIPDDR